MRCAIAAAVDWHSPVRSALAVVFLLVMPGWALAELLEITDLVHLLTIAVSARSGG